jgi:hypothetical protein
MDLSGTFMQTFSTTDMKLVTLGGRLPIRPSMYMLVRMAITPSSVAIVAHSLMEGIVSHTLPLAAK